MRIIPLKNVIINTGKNKFISLENYLIISLIK